MIKMCKWAQWKLIIGFTAMYLSCLEFPIWSLISQIVWPGTLTENGPLCCSVYFIQHPAVLSSNVSLLNSGALSCSCIMGLKPDQQAWTQKDRSRQEWNEGGHSVFRERNTRTEQVQIVLCSGAEDRSPKEIAKFPRHLSGAVFLLVASARQIYNCGGSQGWRGTVELHG